MEKHGFTFFDNYDCLRCKALAGCLINRNSRRRIKLQIFHFFFAYIFLIINTSCTDQNTNKPNIVFILADDVGVGDIKCYYEPTKVKTPNIDKLATQGMRFTQAYAPGSVCSPTRYALISGQYPCRGHVKNKNVNMSDSLIIDTSLLTWPEFFQKQGYRTAHIGKWHLGYGDTGITNWAGEIKPGPIETGFDYHFGLVCNHSDNFKTYVENHRLLWLKESVTHIPGKPEKSDLNQIRYDDEVDATLTDRAIEFIEQNKNEHFFVYLALVATHTHITPNKKFRKTSEIGQLGDYIHELDYHVGEIMTALRKLGLAENTILVFSSDNGGHKVDYRTAGQNLNLRSKTDSVAEKAKTAKADAWKKYGHRTNGDFRGYKGGNYEGGFRVPFIIRWPGIIPKGTESDQVISLVDMLATSAGLLGEELPESARQDSYDLSPVILLKDVAEPIRTETILQTGNNRLAFRQNDWKIVFTEKTTWIEDEAKLPETGIELYDLGNDPGEEHDLSKKYPKRVTKMRERLQEKINTAK